MPSRHYKNLFTVMRKSPLLFLQTQVLFLTTYIDWVIMPFMTKLEGMYLPVFMISFYMLIGASDGFILPLFKHIKIYRIYAFVIILDLIQMASYTLYVYDEVIFTYTILSIFTLQAITFEVSRVHTIDFMKEAVAIKDYLMMRSFIVSGAIIAGSLSAMLLDFIEIDLKKTLWFLGALGCYAVFIELRLYNRFKFVIQKRATQIKRQNSLLQEKFKQ